MLILPPIFKATTNHRALPSVYLHEYVQYCVLCILANNSQQHFVKQGDSRLDVYILVSILIFTYLAKALAPCNFNNQIKLIYGVLTHSLFQLSIDS